MENKIEIELTKYLKANLLIQLELLKETDKPELLLCRAGFGVSEIASILDKKYNTVLKTISRASEKQANKE